MNFRKRLVIVLIKTMYDNLVRTNMNIIQKPCADVNYAKGRQNYAIKALVVHIAQGTLAGTDSWFAQPRPDKPTSAHYIVGKNGEVHQYVPDSDEAYHAGVIDYSTCASWITAQNPNLVTLGIENEGYLGERWTEPQMASLCALVGQLCAKYGIPQDIEHIVSHSAITSYKENMDDWIAEILRRKKLAYLQSWLDSLKQMLANLLKGRSNQKLSTT